MNKLRHIAFIMDGNGRWAKSRNKERYFGHRAGVKALKKIIEESDRIGLQAVSFYAFSTENWKRPKDERDKLFDMIKKFAESDLKKYSKKNLRINIMGDIDELPEDVRLALIKVIDITKNNTGMIINIALNYGGRKEILRAVNSLIESGEKDIDEEKLASRMYTANIPDPDIIVRTSGEKRLSNFMLYQAAYSELVFADEYWPDFNEDSLHRVIEEYLSRKRRFGNIEE